MSGTPHSCFQNISILTVHLFIYSPTTLSRTLLCARHKGQGQNQKEERSMESQRGIDFTCPLEVPTGRSSLFPAHLLHWAVSRKHKILLVIILLPGLAQCLAIIFFFSWPLYMAFEILVSRPGIKPMPPAVETQSPNPGLPGNSLAVTYDG